MCREILNTCIRNTEEAERMMNAAKAGGGAEGGLGVSLGKQTAALLTPRSASTFGSRSGSAPTSSSTSSDSGSISEDPTDKDKSKGEGGEGETEGTKTPTLPSHSQGPVTPLSSVGGKVLKRGVWGMIEDSELARRIRMDEERESGVALPAERERKVGGKEEEEEVLDKAREFIRLLGSSEGEERLVREARGTASALSALILNTGAGEDPGRMEKLLEVNDELLGALNRISTSSKRATTKTTPKTPPKTGGKPNLKLEGLGVDLGLGGDGRLDGFPELNMNKWRRPSRSKEEEEEEEEVTTPRVDKGKGRAEDPRMGSETMLSPKTFRMVGEGEDDEECVLEGDGDVPEGGDEGGKRGVSPLTISRYMVEEEGEVFRKGAVLLGPEEMEGEYAGEELRKELLEAMVERQPPRPSVALTVDDFTLPVEGIHQMPHSSLSSSHPHSNPHSPLLSPHPHLHSPLAHSPLVPHSLSHTTSYSPGPSSPSLTPGPPGIAVSGFRSDSTTTSGGGGGS